MATDYPDEERLRQALLEEDPRILFELFVELYYERSRILLYSLPSLRRRVDDIDDIHQELWERIWRASPSFSLEGTESEDQRLGSASRRSWGWVTIIARRLTIDWLRRSTLQREKGRVPWDQEMIIDTVADKDPSVSDIVENRDFCERIFSSFRRYREAYPDVSENLVLEKLGPVPQSDVHRQQRFRAWSRFSHWFYEELFQDWVERLSQGDDSLPDMSETLREKYFWRDSVTMQLFTMSQEKRDLVWPHLERLLGEFAETVKETVLNRDFSKLLRNGYFPPHLRSQLIQIKQKKREKEPTTLLGKTRAQFRLSTRQFGRELGVSHSLISQVESGRVEMNESLTKALAHFLHCRGISTEGFFSASSHQSWDLQGL